MPPNQLRLLSAHGHLVDVYKRQLEQSAMHPIQGWYITTGGGGSVLNADSSLLAGGIDLRALWPLVIPTSMRDIDAGRGILDVILVIDRTQVALSLIHI